MSASAYEVDHRFVSGLISDPVRIPSANLNVKPEWIGDPNLREVFLHLHPLYVGGHDIDVDSCVAWLHDHGRLDAAGGRGFVDDLFEGACTGAMVEHDAKLIRKRAGLNGAAIDNPETARTNGEEVQPLRLLTAEEFRADEIPDAVIEGMVHRGHLSNLNATNKGGKSYFALQAAMAVAAGVPFLGKATRQ